MRVAARIFVSVAAALAIGCTSEEPARDKGAGDATSKERRPAPVDPTKGKGAPRPNVPTPELAVKKLAPGMGDAIVIDGRLDEPLWAAAATAGPFVDVGSGRERADLWPKGTVKIAWDDAFLYAGFSVEDKTIHGGFPADAKDPHLWERDTVEMMLDPDGDGDNIDYYEIQISPQNLVFDTQYDRYNSPNGNGRGPFGHEEWTAALTSAVVLDGTIDDDADIDRGYTIEAKIPWSSFKKAKQSPPASGSEWRMNFYAMQNNGGSAWSPILGMGNFHRASRFGKVRWIADPDASTGAGADAGAGTDAGAHADAGTSADAGVRKPTSPL